MKVDEKITETAWVIVIAGLYEHDRRFTEGVLLEARGDGGCSGGLWPNCAGHSGQGAVAELRRTLCRALSPVVRPECAASAVRRAARAHTT